jgi:hypothetical protein
MENISQLFWISVLAWIWAEFSALFRIAILKTLADKNFNYFHDRNYLIYKRISLICLNISGFLGLIIIGVSLYNVIGGF